MAGSQKKNMFGGLSAAEPVSSPPQPENKDTIRGPLLHDTFILHTLQTMLNYPKQPKNGLTLGNLLPVPAGVSHQVHWPLSPQALEMISYIPEGGSWKDVPYEHLAPRFPKHHRR